MTGEQSVHNLDVGGDEDPSSLVFLGAPEGPINRQFGCVETLDIFDVQCRHLRNNAVGEQNGKLGTQG